jgi:protein-disulfide isomerase
MKRAAILFISVIMLATASFAQGPFILKPPKGSPIAIAVFEDLQCPECSRTAPVLVQASKTYKIPLVRYDFPLPMHSWSFDAAVMARYFDTHSTELGDAFRDYIFSHQLQIFPANLRSFAEKFAAEHKLSLPFVIDPKGELAAKVNADKALGQRVGIQHTPTVYILNSKPGARPYVEVPDRTQIFQTIDAVKHE